MDPYLSHQSKWFADSLNKQCPELGALLGRLTAETGPQTVANFVTYAGESTQNHVDLIHLQLYLMDILTEAIDLSYRRIALTIVAIIRGINMATRGPEYEIIRNMNEAIEQTQKIVKNE